MALSLYDITVPNYLQILGAVKNVLAKGAEHATANGGNPDDLLNLRMTDDMHPMTFQIISVWHHSLGAIRGIEAGVFTPPPKVDVEGWKGYAGLVDEAIEALEALTPEAVNAMSGNPMKFKMGDFEIPFTTESFVQTFSQPNFYFHATAIYALLRADGVNLGKMDYLGAVRTHQE
ncbi:DUF1993 domain-containing protein [Halioglobus maricola]|uniref:DUF1993 domain-containing protein n=1 Tax=Halioglobus maricola TaxID=2601894 RepID=A0A5P9NIH3_9GAMM|nr:DUF1993 domain-containing protein [Halioglobus maricola]QFU75601.1 DUF1993 domain-containing protein [Halioglobus maricola]